jgi:hypothetical protein
LWVVWPQNHSDGFSSIWASKPMATVYEWFDLKTTQTVFTGLTSKPVATVFSSLTSKSPRWFLGLDLKTKRTSVCWLRYKTDGGRSARDTR